jgi:hypothetical protein
MDGLDCVKPNEGLTLVSGQDIEKQRGDIGQVILLQGDRENIVYGSLSVVLLGKACYTDQRGNSHITTFCRRFEAAKGNLPDRMFACKVREAAT